MTQIPPDFLGYSKVGYLQALANKYGDFKVAYAYKNNIGDLIWCKHRSVLECWHSDEGLKYLQKVNNRAQLLAEIRLDTDPLQSETPEQSLDVFNKLCLILEHKNIPYSGWFSGSRGYHIHILIKKFNDENQKIKRIVAEYLVYASLKADKLKVNNNTMLTIEWAGNNKTGNQKIPLRGTFFDWLGD